MPPNERTDLVRSRMQEEKWDALVCALPSNVLMLSGYWPIVGTGVTVMSADGLLTLLVPEDEQKLARRSWAAEVHTFRAGSLENLKTAAESIAEPLARLLQGHRRIGFEDSAVLEPASYVAMNFYSGSMSGMLERACPGADLLVANSVLSRLKSTKTPGEIASIRKACEVAAGAFEAGADSLKEGISEMRATIPLLKHLNAEGIEREGVDRAGGHVSCVSGARSGRAFGAFARSTRKRIDSGDLVLTHCNSQLDGYWTDITRTYTVGELTPRKRDMYGAIFAAREAALQVIRPGAAACDVDRAARAVLESRGFGNQFKHPAGHGIGFGAIDAHALPRLHPKSPDRLETGMVFNLEPGIYFEDFGGMRQCEMVAVTETGFDLLTPFQSCLEDLIR